MSKQIAEERIERLFELAAKRMKEDREELADRYVELARKIGMKTQVSIPSEYKRKFCSDCHSYLLPGRTCTVRVNSKKGVIEYKCENCGNKDRYPYRG